MNLTGVSSWCNGYSYGLRNRNKRVRTLVFFKKSFVRNSLNQPRLICLYTFKWLYVLLSYSNNIV